MHSAPKLFVYYLSYNNSCLSCDCLCACLGVQKYLVYLYVNVNVYACLIYVCLIYVYIYAVFFVVPFVPLFAFCFEEVNMRSRIPTRLESRL